MPEDAAARLTEISVRLEEASRRLRSGDLDDEEATKLAGECAELAHQAAAELDRIARFTPPGGVPGQEELL